MRKSKMLKRLSERSSIHIYARIGELKDVENGVLDLAERVMYHINQITDDVDTLKILNTVMLTSMEQNGLIEEVEMTEPADGSEPDRVITEPEESYPDSEPVPGFEFLIPEGELGSDSGAVPPDASLTDRFHADGGA